MKAAGRSFRAAPSSLGFAPLLGALLLLASPLAAQTWETVNLHPAGSTSSRLTALTTTRQAGASDGHAGLWNGTAASFVNIQPAGVDTTYIYGVSASQQAGYSVTGGNLHACIWNGTAASFVDLHPAGAVSSYAYGTDGTTQAGYYNTATESHACIWNGTAASFVDVSPAGSTASQIMAAGGGEQGGRIVVMSGLYHAGIWHGTAASFVDLAPAGSTYSLVSATDGATQAGYAIFGGITHAAIWHGTLASFADIHPAAAALSSINAVSGAYQAGYAYFGGNSHAALWKGTAASFVDLHAFLPAGYTTSSANAIWTDGRFIVVAGSASNATREEAFLWKTDLFPPQHRPVVTVKGKKHVTTTATKLLIRGTAKDADGDLAKVQVKVGKRYRTAKGTPARWKFAVPLQPGTNKVLVRAVDEKGTFSKPVKLVIVRS